MHQQSTEAGDRDSKLEAAIANSTEENRSKAEHTADVHKSTRLRLTALLRTLSHAASQFKRGAWAWLSLTPGSRPRRIMASIVIALAVRIRSQPQLAVFTMGTLNRFPWLHTRLRSAITGQHASTDETQYLSSGTIKEISDLSPRAREMCDLLNSAMRKREAAR